MLSATAFLRNLPLVSDRLISVFSIKLIPFLENELFSIGLPPTKFTQFLAFFQDMFENFFVKLVFLHSFS